MNFAMTAICWCLVAQGQAEPPSDLGRFQPKYERRSAPAVPLDDNSAPPAEPEAGAPAAQPGEAAPSFQGRQHEGNEPMAPVEGGPRAKLAPPELLAEALTPREGGLIGKPMSLLAALSRSNDRQTQLRIAQAYWRLCTAQADYHWALDQRDKLAHYTHEHTNEPGTLSARASARADVRDMQLAVTQAQQELLDLLGAQSDEDPPWATDRPHVGGYDTRYEQIFSSRLPPPRIRLIHRTMPVLRKAIDDHGEAISETLDALETTGEDFKKSGQGLATVLATLDQLKRERRAFMADVRDYNQQIAEYVFAVLPATADQETLVSKLIMSARPANPPPARARTSLRQAPAEESPTIADAGALAPAADDAAAGQADELGLYHGLLAVDPPERLRKLTDLLHWDRNLPPDAGAPTSLADCLRGLSPRQRLNVIAHYWRTRERAARYQALGEQWEQLNALRTVAIGLRDKPGMAGANVRLQAARRSAHAAMLDAHAALLNAEFELTQAAGRRIDDPWLLPATLPQSGGHRADAGVPSRDARHWAVAMRLAHAKLEDGSEAVIQADVDRAARANETREGASIDEAGDAVSDEPVRLDSAVRAVTRQCAQTLAMLRDLTAYNMAVTRYVLATSPADVAPDELVRKLIVAQSSEGNT